MSVVILCPNDQPTERALGRSLGWGRKGFKHLRQRSGHDIVYLYLPGVGRGFFEAVFKPNKDFK